MVWYIVQKSYSYCRSINAGKAYSLIGKMDTMQIMRQKNAGYSIHITVNYYRRPNFSLQETCYLILTMPGSGHILLKFLRYRFTVW
jgi:hypothetical protein